MPANDEILLDGITKGLPIRGEKIVGYRVIMDNGETTVLRLRALDVPELSSTRLVSPQEMVASEGNSCVFVAFSRRHPRKSSYARLGVHSNQEGWTNGSSVSTMTMHSGGIDNLTLLQIRIRRKGK